MIVYPLFSSDGERLAPLRIGEKDNYQKIGVGMDKGGVSRRNHFFPTSAPSWSHPRHDDVRK
jgi:hypothetical protein